jgi:hypothetical protein
MQDLSLFKKYKSQFLAACFLLGSVLIIIQVIIPTFTQIQSQMSKNSEEQKTLAEINVSYQLIQSADEQTLKNNLTTAVGMLPPDKNITAIYSALTTAAASSGVFFDGFTVSPGGIYGEKEKISEGTPSVTVATRISNVTASSLSSFLSELRSNPPVSEVTAIKLSGGTADIELKFFYKPYNLSIINSDIAKPLTETEEDILNLFK